MSSLARALDPRDPVARARRARQARVKLDNTDRRANRVVRWLCWAGGGLAFVMMVAIVLEVVNAASSAVNEFGIGFVFHNDWNPALAKFGAWPLIFGTLLTSLISLVLSTVLGISIAIYLSRLASHRVSAVVGPLVELLAAVPSVVLGLIGIVVIAPFAHDLLEPVLHSVLGWIPLFGQVQTTGLSIFTASLVITIMVVPIVSALSRDLFLTVPGELTDAAEALGATEWEVIRGVILPMTSSGVIGACVLGFSRALGEAIAVSEVVGGLAQVKANLFDPGATIAGTIANEILSPVSPLARSSLFYLALILLVFGVATNLLARMIARRMHVGPRTR